MARKRGLNGAAPRYDTRAFKARAYYNIMWGVRAYYNIAWGERAYRRGLNGATKSNEEGAKWAITDAQEESRGDNKHRREG